MSSVTRSPLIALVPTGVAGGGQMELRGGGGELPRGAGVIPPYLCTHRSYLPSNGNLRGDVKMIASINQCSLIITCDRRFDTPHQHRRVRSFIEMNLSISEENGLCKLGIINI